MLAKTGQWHRQETRFPIPRERIVMVKALFHPDALRSISANTEKLLQLVKPLPVESQVRRRPYRSTAARPSIRLQPDDYQIHSTGAVDSITGEVVAIYFGPGPERVGLDNAAIDSLNDIATKLSQRTELRDLVGRVFIKQHLIRWVEDRYKKLIVENMTFIDYLDNATYAEVKARTISIPIRYLAIDKEFELGRVHFSFLPKELFDELEEHWKSNLMNTEQRATDLKKLRIDYQGRVIASVRVNAEPQHSLVVAKAEIEKTIAFLRFFSSSSFIPEIPSYFDLYARDRVEWIHLFEFTDTDFPKVHIVQDSTFRADNPRDPCWYIAEPTLDRMHNYGIVHAHNLLLTDRPSEVDDVISSAVVQYSRSLTSNTFHDKIVFAFVSVETLLLSNDRERIGETVERRLRAITAICNVESEHLRSTLVRARHLRGSFVHHGRLPEEDLDLLQELRGLVWTAIQFLLVRRDTFAEKSDFLSYLDETPPSDGL